jgi:hypothetical protein
MSPAISEWASYPLKGRVESASNPSLSAWQDDPATLYWGSLARRLGAVKPVTSLPHVSSVRGRVRVLHCGGTSW